MAEVTSHSTATVGLVVCTYSAERLPLLHALLASIDAGDRRPDQVVVVVDREASLAKRLQSELADSGADVRLSMDGGLSAARNEGWQATDADWIAFVDDDAVVARDWLSRIMAAATSNDAGILGGRIDPRWQPASPPTWYSSRLGWILGCSFEGMPRYTAPVRSVIGCNMLVQRDVLTRLDGFSRHLGREGSGLMGSEETEFCIRAGKAGVTVTYVPAARVWQVVPPSRRRLRYALRRAWGEGRSKARISAMHGPVLGVERAYARELLVEAVRRIGVAVRRGDRCEMQRGGTLLAVLLTTGTAYGMERLGLAGGAR